MKAAFINDHGDLSELKIGDQEIPKISPNEVLIQTKFGALNHIDVFLIKGWPGLELNMPHILGSDGSGIIKEIGSSVTTISEGDKVTINPGISCGKCHFCLSGNQNFCKSFYIMGEHQWGTYCDYFKVPEENVLQMPSNFSFELAAAAPLTFLTAWRLLFSQAKVMPGETVLIHGAGGGVSTAAIQIAKYLGATTIATTSTSDKLKKTKSIGADYVINYNENPDYSSYIYKEITKRNGIDVIVDSVGKSTFQNSLRLLRPGGRLVTPGATTGPTVEIDIRQIFWKQLKIIGSTMSNQQEFRDVMKLVFEQKLNPIVDKIFPLEEIIKAERYLNQGNQFGKVLLKI
ncbi:MAG: zinc-binding dehydrogenase [Candidatus Lokiarchaeota archaeon]|nr:zinc-binding dehydrogenase [Candidatus Lokiarchaeota archaeon]